MHLLAVGSVTWATLAAWATFLVAVGAVAYAARQVGEARQLREAQTRPFVVVDFDVLRLRPMIYLVITNHGSTLTRNVRFAFDPPLSSAFDDDHRTLADARLLRDGLPTLAPRAEIPILFDSFIERGDERPDAYSVTISYDGERDKQYEDTLLIDLGVYRNLHYIDRKEIHHVHERLEEIAKILKDWGGGFGGGLHVRTDADIQRDEDDRRRRFQEYKATQSPGSIPDNDVDGDIE